ncbi:MAG: type II toxin-antitoxin system RelE/ParE family toxin [Oscillospiraceae bacterium]|nr:type II toxin-antitoxin system RelE/ParE family toxin [Oscillospiraceae bacterium]
MKYNIKYHIQAEKDIKKLDHSQRKVVFKLIEKVAENPLPKNEGGYGDPLGNKHGFNLTGLCKIKLRRLGIRVVYRVIQECDIMKIIVIAARADEEVYEIAAERMQSD